MTPAELIHTVLCMNAKDMWPDWKQPGGPVVVQVEATAITERIVEALAAQGLVVVSAEDLRVALNMLSYTNLPKRNGKSALLRLNAALPERRTDG